jgi:hypothetical protein
MCSLKSRLALLEGAGMLSHPILIYLGETMGEQERARATAALVKGRVIFVSPLDYAL